MKKQLSKKRVAIIGGHVNWANKLREVFPNWIYVQPKVTGQSTSMVRHCDVVYFFTDTMSHCTYFRFINECRNSDVPFKYIHGVNIDNNIQQIYRELIETEN